MHVAAEAEVVLLAVAPVEEAERTLARQVVQVLLAPQEAQLVIPPHQEQARALVFQYFPVVQEVDKQVPVEDKT